MALQSEVLTDFGDEPFTYWEIMACYSEFETIVHELRRLEVYGVPDQCNSKEGNMLNPFH